MAKERKAGLKKAVLAEMLKRWYLAGKTEFTNKDVKGIAEEYEFGNAYDVTKIDNKSILPPEYIEHDVFIAHLGDGKHAFVKGIDKAYHTFEKMSANEIEEWPYQPSLLNESNNSEAHIVSLAYNQSIIHDFLHGTDRRANLSRYDPGRTKYTGEYFIGEHLIKAKKVQMELDSHAEHKGIVDIFEAKNTKADNFAVYQIFLPFLHFNNLREKENIDIEEVRCNYLLREKDEEERTVIKIYQYKFENPRDMSSIKLMKKKQYTLIRSQ